MRALLALACLACLGPWASAEERVLRVWIGRGETPFASDAGNWTGGVPRKGDRIVFDGRSNRPCVWDLDIELSLIELGPTHQGEVRMGSSTVKVGESLAVYGGKVDLDAVDVTVDSFVLVSDGGQLELGRSTVRLGKGGLVQEGGELSSTGDAPARLTSASEGVHFPILVRRGRVRLENKAGTELDSSAGLSVGQDAEIEKLDRVKVTRLKEGAAALKLSRKDARALELEGWSFDETVMVHVDARGLAEGSRLVFAAARSPEGLTVVDPRGAVSAVKASEGPREPELERRRDRWAFQPVVQVEALGGQYFFEGSEGALSGNVRALVSGALRHPARPRWTFVPIYSGGFKGTKQVTDLVGGGTLFQQSMDHRLAARAVYQASPKWRIKPEAGVKLQFLRETKDETWGSGLFDYRRYGLSLEAEYLYRDPFSLRFGYDVQKLDFPNYVSLESQAAGTQGLARELAGESVIDSLSHTLSAAATAEGPRRTLLEARAGLTLRTFGDQKVVVLSGDLSPESRADLAGSLGASVSAPRRAGERWTWVPALSLDFLVQSSNQNSYDAQRTVFLPGYYDHSQWRAGLRVDGTRRLEGERSLRLGLGASFGRTAYAERPVQDGGGTYGTERIRNDLLLLDAGLKVPIAERVHWTGSLQYARQSSNMAFEKLYRYNYSTFAYFAGFTWDY